MRSTIVLALLAHAVPASAAPTWCKGGGDKPTYSIKTLFTETDAAEALRGLVAASCYPDDDVANMTAQIAKTRAAWSKKLALTEDDWTDVAEWAHLPNYLRGDPKISVRDRTLAWSAYSPIDQYGALIDETEVVDSAYLADAFGAKLTQLGRLGYVAACLESTHDDAPVRWAMCAQDVVALDQAKIAAEIRGDATHSAGDRTIARLVAYDVIATKTPKFQADIKALWAKDAAYQKMFMLGESAHIGWSKTDPKLIALAESLDDSRITGSRRASAGCDTKTWDAWREVIGAIPAKTVGALVSKPGNELGGQLVGLLINQPNGYLAALAINECAVLEGKQDFLSRAIGNGIQRWPGYRGPRTATQSAIMTAGLELENRNATLAFPKVYHGWIVGDGNSGSVVGVIESIAIEGERATVTFAKEKVTQVRCTKGHDTNRISQIMTDGLVVYYYQCDAEVTETVEFPPSPPKRIGTRYAAGLKHGMTVRISDDVAVAAYPKGKTVPTIVTGVEVK